MRVISGILGLALMVLGVGAALLLHDAGCDDAGGWMLAAAGVGLSAVALWPGHSPTIGANTAVRKSAR